MPDRLRNATHEAVASADRLMPTSTHHATDFSRPADVPEAPRDTSSEHEHRRSHRHHQALRRPRRRRWRFLHRRRGGDLRHPRAERRRQDHDGRVDRRSAPSPTPGRSGSSGSIRKEDRDQLRTLVGVQLQESELPDRMTVAEARRALRVVLRRSGGSGGAPRGPRADREARHAVPEAVGRPEAAPLDRPRTRRQAEGRDPRRADDRPRPAGPPRDVAAHRGRSAIAA